MNIRTVTPDENVETNGIWFDFDDAKFLIASMMNPNHRALLAKLSRTKFKKAVRTRDEKAMDQLGIEAMIGTVLLDWKGVTDGDVEVGFNHTNALKLLNIPTLREFVVEEAGNVSNFIAKEEEAQKGELKRGVAVGAPVG